MKKQDKKSTKIKTVTIKEQKPRAQAKSNEKRKKTTIQTDDIRNTNPSTDFFTQNYIDTEGKTKGVSRHLVSSRKNNPDAKNVPDYQKSKNLNERRVSPTNIKEYSNNLTTGNDEIKKENFKNNFINKSMIEKNTKTIEKNDDKKSTDSKSVKKDKKKKR